MSHKSIQELLLRRSEAKRNLFAGWQEDESSASETGSEEDLATDCEVCFEGPGKCLQIAATSDEVLHVMFDPTGSRLAIATTEHILVVSAQDGAGIWKRELVSIAADVQVAAAEMTTWGFMGWHFSMSRLSGCSALGIKQMLTDGTGGTQYFASDMQVFSLDPCEGSTLASGQVELKSPEHIGDRQCMLAGHRGPIFSHDGSLLAVLLIARAMPGQEGVFLHVVDVGTYALKLSSGFHLRQKGVCAPKLCWAWGGAMVAWPGMIVNLTTGLAVDIGQGEQVDDRALAFTGMTVFLDSLGELNSQS